MTDVLLVDDEPLVLDVLTSALEDEGYAVAAVTDGAGALALLDRGLAPSIVIADLMMPSVSGVELVAAIRARFGPHAPPVVLMSANARWLEDIEGVTAKLPKPFSLDRVLDVVERHCSSVRDGEAGPT